VRHRHSLRLALQGIGAGVILVAVTGDVGSVTDLAAGLFDSHPGSRERARPFPDAPGC
jgi:hypothetical protein